jgi:hypothetical protein
VDPGFFENVLRIFIYEMHRMPVLSEERGYGSRYSTGPGQVPMDKDLIYLFLVLEDLSALLQMY